MNVYNTIDIESLISNALGGHRAAISRLITLFEREDKATLHKLMNIVQPLSQDSHIIGVVGPPGVGKSTLIGKLVRFMVNEIFTDRKAAVLTVDPSSPITGGAFMGNRIRMVNDLKGLENVYLRSFSSKHLMGGLSLAVYFATRLLFAAGFKTIFIEGVGGGHLDVKPLLYSHTRVTMLTPASGDIIQMLKAGVMEFSDIYVINKSDLGNPLDVKKQLQEVLKLRAIRGWAPPILTTVATDVTSIPEVAKSILAHYRYLQSSNDYLTRIRDMRMTELKDIITALISESLERVLQESDELLAKLVKGEISMNEAIANISTKICEELM